ncbi:glycosyltransferase [Arenibaculum pallidiluteum]|uniref:glycosyltransferase n=1 Tax=Arenibaculum pallidiluteum TaxID=2812559 RepID=UPI001F2BEA10|nr:glycosyltransferase [Arenibaculum pallidiluteum]
MLSPLAAAFGPTLLTAGLALAVLPFCRRDDTATRAVLFSICAFLCWRYIAWRAGTTVPSPDFTLDAICSWAFLLLEAAAAVSSTLSFLVLSRTRNRGTEASAHDRWWGDEPPQVDVLIATYNEEAEILARTIAGAAGIDHPRLRVWVLDDGRRDWLRDLCAEKGVSYLRRTDNAHAKAGNINNALRHLATLEPLPDFLVVLDADFVPHSNFARRALALFHDPHVGLVQTPQHFFNPDPIQANLQIGRAFPDEQRFFFDHAMASRDAWGIAFCCGTSSAIRWNALQEIGGFPTDSVTEDFLVTLRLKEKGYRTVYLNERLSDGLAPEGLKEYVTQRSRWCLGLVQIVRGPLGPLRRNALTLMDRLGLVDSFLYWAATFTFRLACFLSPPLYWFLGVTLVDAPLPEVVLYFGPYFLAVMIALNWTTRGQVVPVLTDVGQMLTMFDAVRAVATGLVKPRGHAFKVTAKGGDRGQIVVQWTMIKRFAWLLALNLGGALWNTLADYAPTGSAGDGKWVVLFWTFYNVTALLLAMAVCVELPRHRRDERFATAEGVVVTAGGRPRRTRLLDLSAGGAKVRGTAGVPLGSELVLDLPGVGAVPGTLMLQGDGFFTLRFADDPALRDRLVRKLHSDRYEGGTTRVRLGSLVADLASRALR